MLDDNAIREALAEGGALAIVEVLDLDVRNPGTRGQSTGYKLRIERVLAGALAGEALARHYGAPLTPKGGRCAVALLATDRFEPALELLGCEDVTSAQTEQELERRIAALRR